MTYPRRSSLLLLALLAGPLAAQAPLLQDEAERLRRDFARWGEGEPAPRTPLAGPGALGLTEASAVAILPGGEARAASLDGGGLGTVLRGGGLAWQHALADRHWELEATFLALRGWGAQTDRLRLQTGRLAYHSDGGWRFALEREPFQWGYGLTGGYLFGTSARAFPRAVVESPMADLSLFHVPLGRWGFEAFLGKLGGDQVVPDWAGDQEQRLSMAKAQGGLPQTAFQGGYRLKAQFGPRIEMNFAVSSQWGGVDAKGHSLTAGYGLSDYLLSYFGAQNTLVTESQGTPDHPTGASTKSQSNGIANVEVRVRPDWLTRALGARGSYVYVSRGAENVLWYWREFGHHPLPSLWRDFKAAVTNYPRTIWQNDRRESAPNLQWPNESVGIGASWSEVDLGFEYLDNRTAEQPGQGYQTYSHWFFLAGHSNGGDPMGDAFGGSIITRTLSAGWHRGAWSSRATFTDGLRVFKDDLAVWQTVHPGLAPDPGRFLNLELQGAYALSQSWRAGASLVLHRERNVRFVQGLTQNGTNALLSLSRRF